MYLFVQDTHRHKVVECHSVLLTFQLKLCVLGRKFLLEL
jgi:hypothetical protein